MRRGSPPAGAALDAISVRDGFGCRYGCGIFEQTGL
jgi:hypothetical protein